MGIVRERYLMVYAHDRQPGLAPVRSDKWRLQVATKTRGYLHPETVSPG